MLSVFFFIVMLSVFMVSVLMLKESIYAGCRNAEFRYDEFIKLSFMMLT
jgi:hypothetical protein